ncbi:hypothetical protein MMC13_005511 [Lambiella insularis]|nr:hypothetical protein [Lambiella insularis]
MAADTVIDITSKGIHVECSEGIYNSDKASDCLALLDRHIRGKPRPSDYSNTLSFPEAGVLPFKPYTFESRSCRMVLPQPFEIPTPLVTLDEAWSQAQYMIESIFNRCVEGAKHTTGGMMYGSAVMRFANKERRDISASITSSMPLGEAANTPDRITGSAERLPTFLSQLISNICKFCKDFPTIADPVQRARCLAATDPFLSAFANVLGCVSAVNKDSPNWGEAGYYATMAVSKLLTGLITYCGAEHTGLRPTETQKPKSERRAISGAMPLAQESGDLGSVEPADEAMAQDWHTLLDYLLCDY